MFALPSDLHLLDVAGPAQAFSMAAGSRADYDLAFVGDEATTQSRQGLGVTTGTEWPPLAQRDLVVVPGWSVGQRDDGSDEGNRFRASSRRTWARPSASTTGVAVRSRASAPGRSPSRPSAYSTAGAPRPTMPCRPASLAGTLAVTVVPDVAYVSDAGRAYLRGDLERIDLALAPHRPGPRACLAARVARGLVVPMRRNGNALQESASRCSTGTT